MSFLSTTLIKRSSKKAENRIKFIFLKILFPRQKTFRHRYVLVFWSIFYYFPKLLVNIPSSGWCVIVSYILIYWYWRAFIIRSLLSKSYSCVLVFLCSHHLCPLCLFIEVHIAGKSLAILQWRQIPPMFLASAMYSHWYIEMLFKI